MVSCDAYGGLRAPATESIVNGTHSIAEPHSLRSETGLRSARCVAKIQSDQVSSSFLGAGGILNSIYCDATGWLPIRGQERSGFAMRQQRNVSGNHGMFGIFVIPFRSIRR